VWHAVSLSAKSSLCRLPVSAMGRMDRPGISTS
jgi:hypothetical protein